MHGTHKLLEASPTPLIEFAGGLFLLFLIPGESGRQAGRRVGWSPSRLQADVTPGQ